MGDLVQRLRNGSGLAMSDGIEDYGIPMDEAADRIEALQRENERLRDALRRIYETPPHQLGQTPTEYHFQKWAGAALSPDTTEQEGR